MSEALRLQDGEDFISSHEISLRVHELGRHFTEYFRNKNASRVHAVALAQGGIFFGADLVRAIQIPDIIWETKRTKRYAGTKAIGKVSILNDLEFSIRGEHVLIIDDIIDEGDTMAGVVDRLRAHQPESIAVASLLDKPEQRNPNITIAADDLQIGFHIANKYVVGGGMDWKDSNGLSHYRNLPHITVVDELESGLVVPRVPFEPAIQPRS